MKRAHRFAGACLVIALASLACRANAEDPPSESFAVQTSSLAVDGHRVDVDVYRPATGASEGVAILAHGFTRERSRHRDLGRALAAAGITAVVPDLPNVMDHWGNGNAIAELARELERGALDLEPVPRDRLVLVGTSAGGLASVLAAAKLPGIAGWVGLDPVDRTGSGMRAASKLASPVVVLLAEPSGCNLFGSGRSIAHAARHLVRAETIAGASHCDFESPTTKFCRVVCGESSTGTRTLARDESVAAIVEILHMRHELSPADDNERSQ